MTNYFTSDNAEGYDAGQLRRLNHRYEIAVYLPEDALAQMSDIEIESWKKHCAEQVLADFDASPQWRGRL